MPIVGRADELRVMSAAYDQVRAGHSQVMLITGAAGIGKTRLVEELTGRIRSAAGGAQVRIGESAPMAGAALALRAVRRRAGERGRMAAGR